jgi:hypothetical protein
MIAASSAAMTDVTYAAMTGRKWIATPTFFYSELSPHALKINFDVLK